MTIFTAPNPEFESVTRNGVMSMPVAKWFGFEFGAIEPGRTELLLPYRDELSYRPGVFQGTIPGALADFAGASSAFTLLPAGWMVSTVDYDVKLIAPLAGDRLIARARVIKPGSTLSFTGAEVFVEKGGVETLCCVAFVTTRNFEIR